MINVDSRPGRAWASISNDSLTTDTITGDALLDLPDNEEDLLAYLEELAAARGIVGGELDIRVDGFEQSAFLPNRNEIRGDPNRQYIIRCRRRRNRPSH